MHDALLPSRLICIHSAATVFTEVPADSPRASVGSPTPGAQMSHPSPSPRLRPEDISEAAVLVANMIEDFLDARKSRQRDGDDSAEVDQPRAERSPVGGLQGEQGSAGREETAGQALRHRRVRSEEVTRGDEEHETSGER